jgi:undecaprenyl-diphosphatase
LLKRLLELDRDWSYALRVAEKPGLRRNLGQFFAHSGDPWLWVLALLMLWSVSGSFWKLWAFHELFWIVVLALIVFPLKFVIRRQRPKGEWGAIYRNTDPHSFPSGHAARAFLIAVLAIFLGPGWLALTLLIWAPLVALARVAMGVHYLSDIAAGALLGIVVALVGWELSGGLFALINSLTTARFGVLLW